MMHEPRQHDDGIGCACGKDWPCPTLTPALPPDRRTYLGGPDVAAIVGVGRFKGQTPIDVWRRKTEGSQAEQTERMAWGLRLEEAIAEGYAAQTGLRVQKRRTPVLHKVYPFLGGSPDRWVVGQPGLLEMKATAYLGDAWADGPPADVQVQAQWYLGLTGRAWADVAVLAGLSALTIYRVERDDALIAELEAEAIAFWREHVLAGVPPPPDATRAYRDYIAERYPRATDVELVATAEQALLVAEFAQARAELKAAKARAEGLGNRLRTILADAGSLVGQGFKVTYRNVKDSHTTAWDLVANAYREVANAYREACLRDGGSETWAETIEALYTTPQPGERRLNLSLKGADDAE